MAGAENRFALSGMSLLAVRNLFHDKTRLAVTLTGIIFALVLIAVQMGLFFGFVSTTSGIIDHTKVDLWITSRGVPFLEHAAPLSERKVYQVLAAAPGDQILFLLAHSSERLVHDRIRNYLQKYLPSAQEVTEKDVLATGAKPGTPKFQKAREELILTKLDARPKKVPPPEVPQPPAGPGPGRPMAAAPGKPVAAAPVMARK